MLTAPDLSQLDRQRQSRKASGWSLPSNPPQALGALRSPQVQGSRGRQARWVEALRRSEGQDR